MTKSPVSSLLAAARESDSRVATSVVWKRVLAALDELTAAHDAATTPRLPIYRDQKLDALYANLYAIGYNTRHGFKTDAAKAEAALIQNEKKLNTAYQAELANVCLFQARDDPPSPARYKSPEFLRVEERAWLRLRDAWVAFLTMLFPDEPRAALMNWVTGPRTFELEMAGGALPGEKGRCRALNGRQAGSQ